MPGVDGALRGRCERHVTAVEALAHGAHRGDLGEERVELGVAAVAVAEGVDRGVGALRGGGAAVEQRVQRRARQRGVGRQPDVVDLGDQVALAGMDGIIRILEVARPKLERASLLASNEKNPRLARYLPDNRTLAVVGNNGQIVVWNAPSAMKTSELILNTAMVSRAALTPSGRQLVLGTIDGRLNLYDLPETSGTPPTTVNTLVAAR